MSKLTTDDDGVALLQQLLDCIAQPTDPGATELLLQLLEVAPTPAMATKRLTIFDVLKIACQETAHSLFLAWLLNPDGPLTDCWLLRSLFDITVTAKPWPGLPQCVASEVSLGGERPDIIAVWERFKLIVEYKIDSPETDEQARRYLDTFGILSPEHGVLLYVTKYGQWPLSVKPGDGRVRSVSYEDVVTLIDTAIQQGIEPEEKSRVLAIEFRNCLARAVNRSFSMDKPTFSEGTRILLQNHSQFKALQEAALRESGDFVAWLSREAAKRLRLVLGSDMHWDEHWERSTLLEYIYRRPTWVINGLEFGIGFGIERDELLSAANFWIGVVIPWPEGGATEKSRQLLSEQFRNLLVEHWPLGQLEPRENEWPLYQYVNYSGVEDPYQWAEVIVNKLVNLTQQMESLLDGSTAKAV